jgi:hypothetical protein
MAKLSREQLPDAYRAEIVVLDQALRGEAGAYRGGRPSTLRRARHRIYLGELLTPRKPYVAPQEN